MPKKPAFFFRTNALLGLLIFTFLCILPSILTFKKAEPLYREIKDKLPQIIEEAGLPPILFENNQAFCDAPQPIVQEIKGENDMVFLMAIDTRETPDPSLREKIKNKTGGGMLLLKDEFVIYNAEQRKEQTVVYKELGFPLNFKIDKESLTLLYEKVSKFIGIFIIFGVLIYEILKLGFIWILFSLIYSSRAKQCGGGNMSAALWTIVPYGVVGILEILFNVNFCIGCIGKIIILILSSVAIYQSFTPLPQDDSMEEIEESF